MSVFDKLGKKKVCVTAPQTTVSNYPSMISQPELYRNLREAVPIIDTAIYKLVRLTGGFSVKSKNGSNQKDLENFVNTVNGENIVLTSAEHH